MEFRKILYLKNKEVNMNNCSMSDDIKNILEKNKPETPLVLRILVDSSNMVIIEYASPISIETIREACKLDANVEEIDILPESYKKLKIIDKEKAMEIFNNVKSELDEVKG